MLYAKKPIENLSVELSSADFPVRDEHIDQLFEAQVEQQPDAIAVVFHDEHLTYEALSYRADLLARHLRSIGVRPDILVGMYVERTIEMIVGLLGILKAGGAYVPLDPAYPAERLAFILADAQLTVLLTQRRLLVQLPERQMQVICLDTNWDMIAQGREEKLDWLTSPGNLAYVIYTSGSTGQPKGVAISCHSLVSYTRAASRSYALASSDRVLQFASLSFDTSVEEIFPSLAAGATLVLRSATMVGSIELFLRQCDEWLISVLNLPTAYWHEIVAWFRHMHHRPVVAIPRFVRLVIIGGEQALPESLTIWHRHVDPSVALVNTYGPTETTVVATACTLAAETASESTDEGEASGIVAIGRPVTGTKIFVLDEHLQPVPAGTSGELFIGGVGLARGYLRRPDLTAERFLPNPFVDDTETERYGDRETRGPGDTETQSSLRSPQSSHSARLYRTGDLVCLLPNGALAFIGRIDYQVKIRGFRIELGEIEAALRQHPAVLTAVVLARQDSVHEKRLVAYVVMESEGRELGGAGPVSHALPLDPQSLTSSLRRFLKERVPAYMLPSVFVRLDALPLTPNGKVDRNALPMPVDDRSPLDETHVALRTPLEKLLAQVWTEVLGIRSIGIHDNFFELGGHSLNVTQITTRLRDLLDMAIPPRDVFDAPTIHDLAERIEALRWDRQSALIPPLTPTPSNSDRPLSFAQQRLWFLNELIPNNPFYTIPVALLLRGPLDVLAFQRGLDVIVHRHETLRTLFVSKGGTPAQIVSPLSRLPLLMVDLGQLLEIEREPAAMQIAMAEVRQPFDLTRAPLLRAMIVRLDDQVHVALLMMHHIASDGWSVGILFRELTALYAAFVCGEEAPLAPLPLQYADFAYWQRHWLRDVALEHLLTYWKQHLAGIPAMLALPTDRSRPSTQAFRGARSWFELDAHTTVMLKALGVQTGCTLFMVLLAAFKALLVRYTGSGDIVVGTPVANRTWTELEELIGFFVNTLVLRTELSGNPTFRVALSRVREEALAAYAHQDLPFEKLVEALQPERSLSYNALCQVLFVFQNAPLALPQLRDVSVQQLMIDTGTTRFDLTVEIEETEQRLQVVVEYDSDLFDDSTITRMQLHFQSLLTGIINDPDQRIWDLPLLTPAEHRQLVQWNDTFAPYPSGVCVHHLIEAQAEQMPDAVAVVFAAIDARHPENECLTYAALNRCATVLARTLRTLGVRQDTLVGLCVERSLGMIVGLFGILKAGGAYVPLDPTYPKERLLFMIENSRASVIVTQERLLAEIPTGETVVICLDGDEWSRSTSELYQTSKVERDNLAYVIYTSGSTGQPKGVLVPHSGLCNLAEAQIHTFGLRQDSHILQFASLSFDASIFEILMALRIGATLYLGTRDALLPGPLLMRLLDIHAITAVTLSPSVLASLPTGDLPLLRTLIVAGEACPADIVARWASGRQLFNAYGPTETTIWATVADCSAADIPPPIGRPIMNTQIHLLDPYLRSVPVGVPGELYIGGVGVARGYLGRPDLTAERFIPTPFTGDMEQGDKRHPPSSTRLYRTGDLARYRLDGAIDFLGRIDHQVKIRGFRIELGDVEVALERHPAVREALVLARADGVGRSFLVAYIIANQEQGRHQLDDHRSTSGDRDSTLPHSAHAVLQSSDLHRFLKDTLPTYMIPSAFVLINALPLTPNGKVDHQALPTPTIGRSSRDGMYVMPRTPVEEVLAGIWADVLGTERVSIHDNFFELGGHSLTMTQVISRLRDAFAVEISPRSMFEAPTVSTLAEQVEMVRQNASRRFAPPLAPVQGEREGPLSFSQESLLRFLNQWNEDQPFYNSFDAMRLNGTLDVSALGQTFDTIMRRHEVFRTNFITKEGQSIQVVRSIIPAQLSLIDLRCLDRSEREAAAQRLAAEESQHPFMLHRDLLLRVKLLRLDNNEHILLLTTHQLVFDGWSLTIFIREISTLYESFVQQTPAHLPDLPIQYLDFATWQRRWLQDEALHEQLAYWEQQLTHYPPALNFSATRPRPAFPSFQAGQRLVAISPALASALKNLSRREGVTLFMTLLATFNVLLYHYTGQHDIVIGAPIANRNRSEIENLIGFFANSVLLRTSLSTKMCFRQLLTQVREVTLGAYSHQDVHFEEVMRHLQIQCQYQVKFGLLQHNPYLPFKALKLRDIVLDYLTVESDKVARRDLNLYVWEEDDRIDGLIVYNLDRFDAEMITHVLHDFQILLETIVQDSDSQLSSLVARIR